MEYFDIVDETGMPTGKTVDRETAHAQGIRHRTAHVWITRLSAEGKRQVLLQKRAAGKDSFPGQFDTSSAGHIQAGDHPLLSAIRELGEELGVHASADDLDYAGTFQISYELEFYSKPFRDNEIAFVYVYSKSVDEKSLKLQEEEVECTEWFDLDEVCRECERDNEIFCVPTEGLRTIVRYFEGTAIRGR